MCTLSWFAKQDGYELFFNRDEQRTRAAALPLQIHQLADDVKLIAPIDPVGKGTWLAVNNKGLSVGLLNYYQGCQHALGERTFDPREERNFLSRGQVVLDLAKWGTALEACEYLRGIGLDKLRQYRPFSILLLDPDAACVPPTTLRWTGRELISLELSSLIISSGVQLERVIHSRSDCFERFCEHPEYSAKDVSKARSSHFEYHRSHEPTQSALSVCMHREDAKTVSFTHINVSHQKATMTYHAGSPCNANAPVYCRSLRLDDSDALITQTSTPIR